MNISHIKPNAGFTLIEMIVAIGIFGVFITIIIGVFSRFMIIERHSIAEGQLISDLQSGIESFIKEARTGYGSTYNVTGAGNNEVAFINQSGECVSYRVAAGVLQRAATTSGGGGCIAGNITPSLFSPLTSTQTKISSIHFNAVIADTSGSGNALTSQGVITVSITAESTTSDINPIQLENTVVSRQMSPYVAP